MSIATAKPKQNQRVRITHRLLCEALNTLLQSQPLESITVTALCQKAGVNRATFYRHFTAPQDILQLQLQDLLEEVLTQLPMVNAQADIPFYTLALCKLLYANAPVLRLLLLNCPTESFNFIIDRMSLELADLMAFLQHEELDDQSLRLLAVSLVGGSYCMLRQWLLDEVPKTPEEVAALIMLPHTLT